MRPSLRDADIRAQSGLPAPKEINIGELVVVVVVIVGLAVWFM